MSEQILTFPQLLDLIGDSDSAVAAEMGVKRTTVRQMRVRGSVHPRHWPALIYAVRKTSGEEISYEMLGRIAVAAAPAVPRRTGERDRISAAHKGWERRRIMLSGGDSGDTSTNPADAA